MPVTPEPLNKNSEPDSDTDNDEYTKLIKKRLRLAIALLDKPVKSSRRHLTKEMKRETLKLVKKAAPLINDDTTNSDDSDSYSEQAFNQHFAREEIERKEKEENEREEMEELFRK